MASFISLPVMTFEYKMSSDYIRAVIPQFQLKKPITDLICTYLYTMQTLSPIQIGNSGGVRKWIKQQEERVFFLIFQPIFDDEINTYCARLCIFDLKNRIEYSMYQCPNEWWHLSSGNLAAVGNQIYILETTADDKHQYLLSVSQFQLTAYKVEHVKSHKLVSKSTPIKTKALPNELTRWIDYDERHSMFVVGTSDTLAILSKGMEVKYIHKFSWCAPKYWGILSMAGVPSGVVVDHQGVYQIAFGKKTIMRCVEEFSSQMRVESLLTTRTPFGVMVGKTVLASTPLAASSLTHIGSKPMKISPCLPGYSLTSLSGSTLLFSAATNCDATTTIDVRDHSGAIGELRTQGDKNRHFVLSSYQSRVILMTHNISGDRDSTFIESAYYLTLTG